MDGLVAVADLKSNVCKAKYENCPDVDKKETTSGLAQIQLHCC